jgi:hypothetical protein
MLERNAAIGKILGEAAPGCEIQLVGFLELCKISFEPRPFSQQPENTTLIEYADVIFPHHIIDRRQLCAIADKHRCQTSEPVFHDDTCGIGIAIAKPAR